MCTDQVQKLLSGPFLSQVLHQQKTSMQSTGCTKCGEAYSGPDLLHSMPKLSETRGLHRGPGQDSPSGSCAVCQSASPGHRSLPANLYHMSGVKGASMQNTNAEAMLSLVSLVSFARTHVRSMHSLFSLKPLVNICRLQSCHFAHFAFVQPLPNAA